MTPIFGRIWPVGKAAIRLNPRTTWTTGTFASSELEPCRVCGITGGAGFYVGKPVRPKAIFHSRESLTLEVQGTARSKLSVHTACIGTLRSLSAVLDAFGSLRRRLIDTKLLPGAPQPSRTHSSRNTLCRLESRSAQ
ncbi:hypothetical protein CCACVL1_01190, partial [Corchorus capsularis]